MLSIITNVVRCAIWYHLYNLKNVKNTHVCNVMYSTDGVIQIFIIKLCLIKTKCYSTWRILVSDYIFQNLSESLILNKLVTLVLGNNCYDILFIFLQRWPHNDVTICLDSETKKNMSNEIYLITRKKITLGTTLKKIRPERRANQLTGFYIMATLAFNEWRHSWLH